MTSTKKQILVETIVHEKDSRFHEIMVITTTVSSPSEHKTRIKLPQIGERVYETDAIVKIRDAFEVHLVAVFKAQIEIGKKESE